MKYCLSVNVILRVINFPLICEIDFLFNELIKKIYVIGEQDRPKSNGRDGLWLDEK